MENKYILFVFFAEGNNRHAFSYAVDLAIKKKAELLLFTKASNPENSTDSSNALTKPANHCKEDVIYLQILDLKGYYLSFSGRWKEGFPVKTRNWFVTNELNTELKNIFDEINISDLVLSISSVQIQQTVLPDLEDLLINTKKNLWIFYKDGQLRKKKYNKPTIMSKNPGDQYLNNYEFNIDDGSLN